MAETTKTPLLDLDTFVERDPVRIDGETYELKGPGDLSWLQAHRLRRLGARVQAILDTDEPSEEELQALDELTLEMLREVLVDLPEEVALRMPHGQRWQVLLVFTARSMPASVPRKKAGQTPEPATTPQGTSHAPA
jgi:hypothetical protein